MNAEQPDPNNRPQPKRPEPKRPEPNQPGRDRPAPGGPGDDGGGAQRSDPPAERPADRAAMLERARRVAAERDALDGSPEGAAGGGSRSLTTYRWSRWLHVYTSMVAFVVILFFGITGVTLNHPEWTFGDATNTETIQGTLDVEPIGSDGAVNFLGVSEWIRAEYDIGGAVSAFNSTGQQATIAYRNPGYEADLIFNTQTGEFTLNTVQSGWVGVMNDLHKGRNADTSWRWLIDVSGLFLVAVSLTGIVMQFYLRKRRKSAYISAAVGGVILVILGWIALH